MHPIEEASSETEDEILHMYVIKSMQNSNK